MLRIFAFFLWFIMSIAHAETISHKGIDYKLDIKSSELSCPNFTISIETRSIPFNIRESRIPHELTAGHYGNPHLIEQSYSTNHNLEKYSIKGLLPTYNKIDSKRKYIARVKSCVGSDSVLISFWGGGNCSTVCEAWSLVKLSKQGKVLSSKGLTYAEFKQYN